MGQEGRVVAGDAESNRLLAFALAEESYGLSGKHKIEITPFFPYEKHRYMRMVI